LNQIITLESVDVISIVSPSLFESLSTWSSGTSHVIWISPVSSAVIRAACSAMSLNDTLSSFGTPPQ